MTMTKLPILLNGTPCNTIFDPTILTSCVLRAFCRSINARPADAGTKTQPLPISCQTSLGVFSCVLSLSTVDSHPDWDVCLGRDWLNHGTTAIPDGYVLLGNGEALYFASNALNAVRGYNDVSRYNMYLPSRVTVHRDADVAGPGANIIYAGSNTSPSQESADSSFDIPMHPSQQPSTSFESNELVIDCWRVYFAQLLTPLMCAWGDLSEREMRVKVQRKDEMVGWKGR
ncbi:hypothetical protein BJ165DRAFT_1535764 [Panaeolus papilionaceus]|nr:hypothetical protein BJ165DRAFT_1535764 [Panaeolus papilionaceus]